MILTDAEHAQLVDVAEGQMLDECVITADAGAAPVLNDDLEYDPVATGAAVYAGRCEVQGTPQETDQTSTGQGRASQGQTAAVQTRVVKVPLIGSEQVRPNHVVSITAAYRDAGMLHRRFRVQGISSGTHATSRRLQCTEITGQA